MSDNFIPFNQSTPIQGGWQQKSFNYNNASMTPKRGGFNKSKKSRKHSFGNDDYKPNIEAYLHPSMLQDPWYRLRQNQTV